LYEKYFGEECEDKECKFYTQKYLNTDGVYDYYGYCTKHRSLITDVELCADYIKAEKCFNCKHSKTIVYETGTIDCIDYHCKLQNDKMLYSDSEWETDHYADFPDCNIDKWESR
jgi:hypothetical protein